jgi:hypothetical protein
VTSWKYAGINRGRHGSRRIIFGKVALAMFSKSSEATPDRLAHITATLSQGRFGRFAVASNPIPTDKLRSRLFLRNFRRSERCGRLPASTTG